MASAEQERAGLPERTRPVLWLRHVPLLQEKPSGSIVGGGGLGARTNYILSLRFHVVFLWHPLLGFAKAFFKLTFFFLFVFFNYHFNYRKKELWRRLRAALMGFMTILLKVFQLNYPSVNNRGGAGGWYIFVRSNTVLYNFCLCYQLFLFPSYPFLICKVRFIIPKYSFRQGRIYRHVV